MRRGEVRWHQFAAPEKRRPVVILTRNSIIASLGEVTVAPVTMRIRGIPSEVPLSADDGLPRDCAVNYDHIQTVSKGKLGPAISTLSNAKMRSVASAVGFALDVG